MKINYVYKEALENINGYFFEEENEWGEMIEPLYAIVNIDSDSMQSNK